MRADVQKLTGLMLVTFVICVCVVVLGPRLLGIAAGPEGELITTLKKAERDGLELPIAPYGTLRGTRVQYQRLSVTFDGDAAVVTGTLDFTGTFGLQPGAHVTKVSSLGLERVAFVRRDGEWEAQEGLAPRLTAIVRALEQRRRAMHAADATAGLPLDVLARLSSLTRRVYRSDAWFIRSEREGVEVAEDYRLTGDLPERPVGERATRRLSLVEKGGGLFVFDGG